MKKIVSLFLSISLILLVACHDEQADIYSAHMNVGEENSQSTEPAESESTDDGLSGTLLLSALDAAGDYSNWSRLADGFMELHPNVEVIPTNENGMGFDPTAAGAEERAIKTQQYKTELIINLTSGNAPDIIVDYSYLISDIAPSGTLMDLNEFIENDETFIEEDFFMNVIKSNEMGGVLTAMPIGFFSNAVRFNTDMLDAVGISLDGVETADYNIVLDSYNEVVDSGEFPDLKSLDRNAVFSHYLFWEDEILSSIDTENFTANFDTDNFRDCLTQMKDYIGSMGEIGEYEFDYTVFDNENHLVELPSSGLYQDTNRLIMDYPNASDPYPLVSSNGEHIVEVGTVMSIPKNAKNPELAWEFIKYCTYESEKVATYQNWETIGHWDGDRFNGTVPINKGNFEKYVDVTLNGYPEDVKENLIEYIYRATSLEILQGYMFESLLTDIVPNFIGEYFDGFITLDECIKGIQERTDIYFAEIK